MIALVIFVSLIYLDSEVSRTETTFYFALIRLHWCNEWLTDIWAPLHCQDTNWKKTTKSRRGLQIMLFLFESRERNSFMKIGPYSVMWWLSQCYAISMERVTWSSPSILPLFAQKLPPCQSILELFGCLLNLLKLSNRFKSCWLDYWRRDTAGFP